jgi:oligogalacturonide lyase
MFGPSYVFAAEVAKAVNPEPKDVVSTPELAKKYNPTDPPNSKGPIVPAARPTAPPPGT